MATHPMYKAIHHDRRNSLVFVWYVDGTVSAEHVQSVFYTPNMGEYGSMACGMHDIYGKEMYRVVVPNDMEYELKKRHEGSDNYLCECDIDFRTRWLQTHYTDTEELRFNVKDFNVGYIDIEVETAERFPSADKAERPINCVTIYISNQDTYYTFGLGRDLKPETYQKFRDNKLNVIYTSCKDEPTLLKALFLTIGSSNLDLMMAWNGDWYDFPYIVNRAEKCNVDLRSMSRLPAPYKSAYFNEHDHTLEIAGTQCIDQMRLFQKFTQGEMDSYRLDDVGYLITKERKAPLPDGYHSYRKYWDEYVFYNVQDVKLQVKIEEKKKMLETTIGACSEAKVPFGAIFQTKKMLVGFILDFLHKSGLVFPPLKKHETETFPGAIVYSTPGYYEWLVSYDYRSMYPSIMMGANISPETKVEYPAGYKVPEEELKNLVRSPWTANGRKQVFYRRDKEGIVPAVTKKIFDGRTALKNQMKKCKKNGDKDGASFFNMKQNAYKIFGNGFYGLLGNSFFQLYDIDNSASITAFGVDLISSTIAELTRWIECELGGIAKYEEVFGFKPTINPAYFGTVVDSKGETCFNRLSHGDTDSFFVKFDDLYAPFIPFIDKNVEVFVFDGDNLITKERFDFKKETDESIRRFFSALMEISEEKPRLEAAAHTAENIAAIEALDLELLESRKDFYLNIDADPAVQGMIAAINLHCKGAWDSMDDDSRGKLMFDGYYTSKKIRIIYNRFNLTDYCRIFDTAIVENKLDGIMATYSAKWNYKENTSFLKREKCINKAIVTAKKKYICYVQSNEDIKYKDPEFAITGLEIVRSSTTPFGRKYILNLVTDMLNIRDSMDIKNRLFAIKTMFYDMTRTENVYDLSSPSGVKTDPPKYEDMINMPKGTKIDWRVKSASVWNYLIETDPVLAEMILEPIYSGSKVKFIDVFPNKFGVSKLAYIGKNCPARLFDYFKPNWDSQWESTFGNSMGRLFDAVGWGSNFEKDDRDLMNILF